MERETRKEIIEQFEDWESDYGSEEDEESEASFELKTREVPDHELGSRRHILNKRSSSVGKGSSLIVT